ncbi:hypothetical protein CYMTET_19404 [Cymbomonas tetramitiformis]|uniref:Uncharacterized protein n=1 Tax=Cymbomonas tetramitiformis TaxID=36881 RepID=A0AAE0L502_9CHLO|nr:hypothetical protein CYMTET_19404 [Cymbomonas tetramitiformis]
MSVFLSQVQGSEDLQTSMISQVVSSEFSTEICESCTTDELDELYGHFSELVDSSGCEETQFDDIAALLKGVLDYGCTKSDVQKNGQDQYCAPALVTGLQDIGIDITTLTEGTLDMDSLDIGTVCTSLKNMGCCWPTTVDLLATVEDATCSPTDINTYVTLIETVCSGKRFGFGYDRVSRDGCSGYSVPEVDSCSIKTDSLHGVDCAATQAHAEEHALTCSDICETVICEQEAMRTATQVPASMTDLMATFQALRGFNQTLPDIPSLTTDAFQQQLNETRASITDVLFSSEEEVELSSHRLPLRLRPPPSASPSSPPPSPSPPDTTEVIAVSSVVRFSELTVAAVDRAFNESFKEQMAASANVTTEMVTITKLSEGSLIVDSTVEMPKSDFNSNADLFASTLETNPAAIFEESNYFEDAGTIESSNVVSETKTVIYSPPPSPPPPSSSPTASEVASATSEEEGDQKSAAHRPRSVATLLGLSMLLLQLRMQP